VPISRPPIACCNAAICAVPNQTWCAELNLRPESARPFFKTLARRRPTPAPPPKTIPKGVSFPEGEGLFPEGGAGVTTGVDDGDHRIGVDPSEASAGIKRLETDWLAGSGGFELANVVLRSMLNSFRNCRLIPERLAARDLSRASCRKAGVYLLAELARRPRG
jgi:hypothetical protein